MSMFRKLSEMDRTRVTGAAKKAALVTGAGGFVGRHIVSALSAAGYLVTALDQAYDADLLTTWAGTPAVECLSLGQPGKAALADTLGERTFDVLVHAAAVTASPEQTGQSPVDNLRANLDPTWDILSWFMHASPAGRAILISSSGVYRSTPPGPVSEDMPPTPLGTYAVAKATIESIAETLNVQYGHSVIAVRLSNLYGPGERPRSTRPNLSLIGRMVTEAITQGHIRIPDEPARDWTYVADVGAALAVLAAAPAPQFPLYNVASGMSAAPGAIAAILQHLVPGLTVETVAADRPLTRLGWLSSARLHKETGFHRWTSLEEGIRATLQAAREAASGAVTAVSGTDERLSNAAEGR